MAGLRLGVLGGTFDPVHVGHLVLGETAREELRLERVRFLPAGQPWRKVSRSITDAEHRVAMLRLAIDGNPAFEVSTLEVERPGPSYTARTLEFLQKERPGCELFFILGEDALGDVPYWHQPQRILELAMLAVARRLGDGEALAEADTVLPGFSQRLVWLEMPRIDISASAIRERVRHGLSIRYLVPEGVAAYIREHGLYRG